MQNHYDILEIKLSATSAEVKASYRRLAKKYHPDIVGAGHAAERFREIQMAYDVLSDPEKRIPYDSRLLAQRRTSIAAGIAITDRSMRQPLIIAIIVIVSGIMAWVFFNASPVGAEPQKHILLKPQTGV